MKALGADRVIDYTKKDFTKEDERYNFVFDTVGKSSFFKCKSLLLNDGVYISSDLGLYGSKYLPADNHADYKIPAWK